MEKRNHPSLLKANVIRTINAYNKSHDGRGGIARAVKIYGIAFKTAKAWLAASAGTKSVRTKQAKPSVAKKKAPQGLFPGRIMAGLKRIEGYQREIIKLQKDIEKEKAAVRGMLK